VVPPETTDQVHPRAMALHSEASEILARKITTMQASEPKVAMQVAAVKSAPVGQIAIGSKVVTIMRVTG